MKTKGIVILSCFLVIILTACSIFNQVGNQIQSTPSPSQESEVPGLPTPSPSQESEVPGLPTMEENAASPTQTAKALPPHLCPDNLGKIVFQYDPMDRTTVHQGIYLMNADGSGRVRLSDENKINDTQPSWSPDRCRIAFRSFTQDGDDDIYVMNADGSSIQRLTTDPERDMFPDWSPDGKQIVFVSYRNGGIRNLWVMNADGSNQHQLTFNPAEYTQWERWSPVGDEIAYIFHPTKESSNKGGVIYLINADGSNIRQLTPDAGSLGDTDLTWSPDGTKVYFMSNRSSYVEIWEINVDGSGLRQITNSDNVNITHSLRVSPDGTQLAFYGVGPDVGQHSQEIYVINVDGSGLTDVSQSPGQEEWLDW